MARFVRLPEDPRTAEFAIVVGDEYQRQGLATRAAAPAGRRRPRRRGIDRFRATMLSDNVAIQRMLERLAVGDVSALAPAATVTEIEIALPTLAAAHDRRPADRGARSRPDAPRRSGRAVR